MKYHWTSYFSLVVMVMIWGSAFALTRMALQGFSPVGVASGRLLLGALVVAPIAIMSGQGLPKTLKNWGWCGLLGVTNFVVPFTLIAWGQLEVPSNITATIVSSIPLFVLFFSWLFLKTPVSKRKWVGFTIGLIGLIWLADPRSDAAQTIHLLSYIAILAACMGMALGAVIISMMPNMPSIQAMSGTLIVSALVALPFGWREIDPGMASQTAIIGLLLLGVLPTGIAQILRHFTVKRTSPVFVATATYLIPIWAGFLGYLFLDERLSLPAVLAYALIVTGLLISRDRAKKRPRQP